MQREEKERRARGEKGERGREDSGKPKEKYWRERVRSERRER